MCAVLNLFKSESCYPQTKLYILIYIEMYCSSQLKKVVVSHK